MKFMQASSGRFARMAAAVLLLSSAVAAQAAVQGTSTTRAQRTVHSHFSIWYKPVDAQGRELSSSWAQYGYVKHDVTVDESSPFRMGYAVLRMQPVATSPNATLEVTQRSCVLVDAWSKVRCFYTVRTTVKLATTAIKHTDTYKISANSSVEAGLPAGAKFNAGASGEGGANIESSITPTFSFERSFEFLVQFRNGCTTNPGFSVYTQGAGNVPHVIYSQCTAPVPYSTNYCGTKRTPNRMANGQVDGEWVFIGETPNWTTLRSRSYRLYRNGSAVNPAISVVRTCAVNSDFRHHFTSVRHDDGDHLDTNFILKSGYFCTYTKDGYSWDWQENAYSNLVWRNNGPSGIGCPGQSYAPITVPSWSY